jgi:hypothetical protein
MSNLYLAAFLMNNVLMKNAYDVLIVCDLS